MQEVQVPDRGSTIAICDSVLIIRNGVLRCFREVAEPLAIGPGHFVASADARMDGYQPVPIRVTRVAASTKS